MKKGLWVLGVVLFSTGLAWADDQALSDALTIIASAPPALIYVTDSQGRRTGPDPSKLFGADGSQDSKSVLSEIPLSQALQSQPTPVPSPGVSPSPIPSPSPNNTPIASPTPLPATSTVWTLSFLNGGDQIYSLTFKGTVLGVSDVFLSGLPKRGGQAILKNFSLFVTPGQNRKVDVTFDPDGKSLEIKPNVNIRDLCDDVERAAKLKLITTPNAVSELNELAVTASNFWNRKQLSDAESALLDFLNALGDPSGNGRSQNISAEVQADAQEALKDEAKALLDQLPQSFFIKFK